MIIPAGYLLGPLVLEKLNQLGLRKILLMRLPQLPHIFDLPAPAPRIHQSLGTHCYAMEITTSYIYYRLTYQLLYPVDAVALVPRLVPQLSAPGKQ